MARIPLIEDRTDDLTEEQLETYDWVVQSRGKMIRPFEVMLHTPTIARHAAELGAQIRFGRFDIDSESLLPVLQHLAPTAIGKDALRSLP